MAYIKKLVMKGFKSFPKKTEVPFSDGINVVLGPNGSGKSNISDALCFVLGRLSVKSMRAAKARNLIFQGSKSASQAKEAVVEIIFDNSDNAFAMDKNEISIERTVRRNGQSIYRINGETKTRQEVLSLLAQAGIDPHGFNIILQGQIQNFVKMHNEERRKVIEEVAGISVYESRKEKSLKELKNTDEKLKEVNAVLKERTNYLNNLEKERKQALRYKKLQQDVKSYKASIVYRELTESKKEAERINNEISKKEKESNKIKSKVDEEKQNIQKIEEKVSSINKNIQESSGQEQEQLNQEIANTRAEIEGLKVKVENNNNRLKQNNNRKEQLQKTIEENEKSVKELQEESPEAKKKEKELSTKKKQLETLEEERKKHYMFKSELKSLKERLEDKENNLKSQKNESDFLVKQTESLEKELYDRNSTKEKIDELENSVKEKKDRLQEISKREQELEKNIHTHKYEIDNQNQTIEKISKMDVCPLCKNKITENHVKDIKGEINPKIEDLQNKISEAEKEITSIEEEKQKLNSELEKLQEEISKREKDISKISDINEKKQRIKELREKIKETENEVTSLKNRKENLEKNFDENSDIEKRCETLKLEIQEISSRSEENVNSEISFKKKELERAKISLKEIKREEGELNEEIQNLNKQLKEKEEYLNKKKKQEEELSQKFKKLISERDNLQKQIRDKEGEISEKQNKIRNYEQELNNLKIEKAKVDAEIENKESEMLNYPDVKVVKTDKKSLQDKLNKTQQQLDNIGSVNPRSLEVYDSVKKEYDEVSKKAETINKEKENILKVIHEIDVKKKKAFLKTFNELNEIFGKNFKKLSAKGEVYLELENKKDPFSGGVNVIVKTGHGKYFDITSLSGGEQVLVALSLIFAIQELSPYCFYILDEIDAALDKRNSQRLAGLLNKYMEEGQYIIVSHNDEIINNASTLYGVSMHDGISKIVSMEV